MTKRAKPSEPSTPRRDIKPPDADEAFRRVARILVDTGRSHRHGDKRIMLDVRAAFKASLEEGTEAARAVSVEASQLDQLMPLGTVLPATLFLLVFERFGLTSADPTEKLRLLEVVDAKKKRSRRTTRTGDRH